MIAFGFLGPLLSLWFAAQAPPHLPGTEPLDFAGDPAAAMVAGMHRHLDQELEAAAAARGRFWNRDFASWEAYKTSIRANRERLRYLIGAADQRLPATELQLLATTREPALLRENDFFQVFRVRWPALEGVDAEGLLLEPRNRPVCRVVALPDADQTPEQAAGLEAGGSAFGAELSAAGCQVVILALVDRRTDWSGNPALGLQTNQPHREWIYRQAYQLGRHIIGLEANKVLSAVDWFEALNRESGQALPIGVAGYGEGGLLALYAAALDDRIDATLVSGYFAAREDLWEEPIYRNVHGLLQEFGDAEIASMILPRRLVVEYSEGPATGPPPPFPGGRDTAAPGVLDTPPYATVRREWHRMLAFFPPAKRQDLRAELVAGSHGGTLAPMSRQSLSRFLDGLGARLLPRAPAVEAGAIRAANAERQRRIVTQLQEYCQRLLAASQRRRQEYWKESETVSAELWNGRLEKYRQAYHSDILGIFPKPTVPTRPRTRAAYRTDSWTGYEVMLDVYPEVFAYGILLVPNDLAPGEKRPVVVCQHGLEGRPQMLVDIAQPSAYHAYAARLADQGYIVYAPQNPYIGKTAFRLLNRKANPLGKTFFGIVLRQHQRTVDWLAELPFVDADRIGLYGLSYGGVTAMRLPPLMPEYKLAICSANFNDWVYKIGSTASPYTYLYHHEFEMFGEFDVANRFNYSDLASMIAPRPFMVERGHRDGAGVDELVAAEFARVRRLYARLGIPDLARIEFFDGGHEIRGEATFAFLAEHLGPARSRSK